MGLGLVLMTDLEGGVLEFGHRQSRWLSKERSCGRGKTDRCERKGVSQNWFGEGREAVKCFGEGERGWIAKFTRKCSIDFSGCQYFFVIVLVSKPVLRGSD